MTDLKDRKIIYTFDSREDYDDLMQYLEDEGVRWCSGNKPTEFKPAPLKKIVDESNIIAIVLKSKSLTWDIKSEIERKYSNREDFEKVHWKKGKEKDISLADFLGWEEGAIYHNGPVWRYKISKGKLYTRLISDKDWAELEDYKVLKNLKKYEPKYMIKTPFVSSRGTQYLSKEIVSGEVFVASKLNKAGVIQEFTKEEAEKLVREYKLNDLFEIVEVVE